jgi:hypothetical protein
MMVVVTFFMVVILFAFSVALSPVLIVSTKVQHSATPPKKRGETCPHCVGCGVDNYIWWGVEMVVHLPGSGDVVWNYPFTQGLSKIPLGITPPCGRLQVLDIKVSGSIICKT